MWSYRVFLHFLLHFPSIFPEVMVGNLPHFCKDCGVVEFCFWTPRHPTLKYDVVAHVLDNVNYNVGAFKRQLKSWFPNAVHV